MDKKIDLGPEAQASVKIEDNKLKIGVVYVGTQASANAGVELDIDQFAKLLKDAIPGKIDDSVIDVLVAAMKLA